MNEKDSPKSTSRQDTKPNPKRDPAAWVKSEARFAAGVGKRFEKYWRRPQELAFRPGAAFFDAAVPIVKSRRTLMAYDKLYVIWQAVRNVAGVSGAAAEIGVYKGGSSYLIASAFISMAGGEVPMHVFDTFEGHPAQAITEHDTFHAAGHFSSTRYKKVVAYLSPFQQLQVHAGDVSVSLPGLAESVYRLVHIDTDLYKPTLDCLDYFGHRMSPGGVIVVDDYSSPRCLGVSKAAVEYLQKTDVRFRVWDMRTEQLILVRC
jgi:O-methyltransferase